MLKDRWVVWAAVASLACVTLCGALWAGLSLAKAVSASGPVPHLPTPIPLRTPGAVIEWQRPTPRADTPDTGGWVGASPASRPEHASAPELAAQITSAPAPVSGVPERARDLPRMRLPVDGPMTQGFGCSPFYTGIPGPGCPADAFWFHDGVDIRAPIGASVQAGMAGRVNFAGADGDGPLCNRGYRGYGLAVVVDSGGGWQMLYAHLSHIAVAVDQVVTPETMIGLSGDTGCVSGPHLHFGLRQNGQLVDPQTYLGERP